MRTTLPAKLEAGRLLSGEFGTHSVYGANGIFDIHGPCGAALRIVASDGTDNGELDPWEHVSVSTKRRTPNWQEMSFVKDLFWKDDECVMQLHPPKSEHINNHPYCLHMWRPLRVLIPTPPSIMVGTKALGDLTERFKSFRGGTSSTPRDAPAPVSSRSPADEVSG